MHLFKIVTARDDITIGFTDGDIQALDNGRRLPPLDTVVERVAGAGAMTCWQYAPGRGPDDAMALVAVRRVGLFAHQIVRIEPAKAEMKVYPPPA